MIYLILILALVLRAIKLDQSFWLDEAINVVNAQNLPLWEYLTRYPIGDFHPPLYFAILWIWSHLFGFTEWVVRIPSVIFGIASVFMTYLLGKLIFEKKVALLAGLFLSLSPLHVYYSQEARMYSLAAFSVALSFYFLIRLKDGLRFFWGYIFSLILVIFSDYLAYFILPAQFVFITLTERKLFFKFFTANFLAGVTFLLWLPVFKMQLLSGTLAASNLPGWAVVVGGTSLKELLLLPIKTVIGRISVANKQIYGAVLFSLGAIYGTILWFGIKKLDQERKLLLCWIVIPVALAFLMSFFIPVFSYFRFIFILPGFYLLLAKSVVSLPSKFFKPAVAIICFTSIIFLSIYYGDPRFQRENWRNASQAIDSLAQKDAIILFENSNLPAPFIYYSQNKSPALAGLKKIPAGSEDDVIDLETVPIKYNQIFLFEYLVGISDPRRYLEEEIERKSFVKQKTFDFTGVGFVHQFVKIKL